jgi:hypothetical protein
MGAGQKPSAVFCYLKGKAYSEGAVEKNRILRKRSLPIPIKCS